MKSTGSFLTRPSLGLNTIPWMRGSSRRANCVVETSDPLSDSWAMICPVSAALTTPVQRRYGNEEYYRPTLTGGLLHCVPFSYSSFTSFSFTSILLRCTGPVEHVQHITIRRVISSHPVQSTCLEQIEALLDNVQLHQLEVALLIVLWCKLVERIIINILIIQQNNIYRLSSALPQSGPDSPCEGGTRPGSDAASCQFSSSPEVSQGGEVITQQHCSERQKAHRGPVCALKLGRLRSRSDL